MFCVKCGKEVKDGTKFCTNCGAELEAKEAPKEEVKDDKLTYSQNDTIKTTSNPTPAEKPASTGDGKGTASLVLGIVSFIVPCAGFITSIIGLILGICAKKSGKKTAGIILNAIALGLIIISAILLWGFGYYAVLLGESTTPTTPSTPSIITPITPSVKPGKVSSTGTVLFDGFEITLGNSYSIVTIDNTSSSNYGKEVIKLPATIKNVSASGDHLNMFYYDYIAPDGQTIDSVRNDFGSRNDAIDYVHVNSGESKIQYFYILYKGNGKYKIDFNNYKESKSIEFTINK